MIGGVWPLDALQAMLAHDFMAHAFLAATPIAAAAGLAGYYVILGNQVFLTDALSHVAFTAALAAYAFAVEPLLGLFAGTVGLALLITALGERSRARDVTIGTVFAWALGLGVLFLSIYTTSHSAGGGAAAVRVLFGSVFGVTRERALVALACGGGVVVAVLALARPLLFATLAPEVAAARGVPVRAIGLIFAALVGVIVAEAVQVVGSVLLVGLMVTPAAAVMRLTARPYLALLFCPLLAVACAWAGLTTSYAAATLPPSFVIIAFAFGAYVLALAWSRLRAAAA